VPFSRYCEGTVMLSPYVNADKEGDDEDEKLNSSYDAILESHLNDNKYDNQKRISLNHSERVCALRNFNRKNMVRYMQQNKTEY
jgi:hypothetical protein